MNGLDFTRRNWASILLHKYKIHGYVSSETAWETIENVYEVSVPRFKNTVYMALKYYCYIKLLCSAVIIGNHGRQLD